MKLKVSLTKKATGEPLLTRVMMRFEGSAGNLQELMSALEEVKAECNTVANKNGAALNECEASVILG